MIDASSYAYRFGMAQVEVTRLREALEGLVGLTELVCARDDVPEAAKDALRTNHRILEARRVLSASLENLVKIGP